MVNTGLTTEEVRQQTAAGNVNVIPDQSDKTVKQIILENVVTYFNIIFFVLAILVIAAGSWKNLMFLPVVIGNTVIGIFQQLRAKKTLDKLSLLDQSTYTVIRNGVEETVRSDSLVLGDLVLVKAGQQIPADGYVEEGYAEVNESLLTGEADEIVKQSGSELKSGSFVVSGSCYMLLTNVGADSYAAKLMSKAKEVTDKKSEMIRDIETIIKIAGILIIPIGLALFIQSMVSGNGFSQSIISMVGAVIGMIPEGMYLLTTVALALSALRLAQKQVLLHDMRSIETLARVDVLCVDKTGTITNDKMTVTEVFPADGLADTQFAQVQTLLDQYVHTIADSNLTMEALLNYFTGTSQLNAVSVQEFSSKTKYSSIRTADAEYRLGAPEMALAPELLERNRDAIELRANMGQRVLAFAFVRDGIGYPLAFISLENEIRQNAKEIFTHFAEQDVAIKVISGDNPLTVSRVAQQAGIANADKYIDAGTLTTPASIEEAAMNYTVFGRVKPEQKRQLVEALQKQKLKVAMTGDGVNDILAMKKADCSIAMGTGSDAARQAAQVVLLDSDFSHLKNIVSEGRRDINNITRSAILFLYKNMFSLFLAVFSIINSFSYPLQPSQISLISAFNIGVPSFFLALEANEGKQRGRFLTQTLLRALPAAITSFLSIAAMVLFARMFNLPETDIGTASTYLLAVVGFIILFQLATPLNKYRTAIIGLCLAGFIICLTCFYSLFSIEALSIESASLCIVFALAEVTVIRGLTLLMKRGQTYLDKREMEKAADTVARAHSATSGTGRHHYHSASAEGHHTAGKAIRTSGKPKSKNTKEPFDFRNRH